MAVGFAELSRKIEVAEVQVRSSLWEKS